MASVDYRGVILRARRGPAGSDGAGALVGRRAARHGGYVEDATIGSQFRVRSTQCGDSGAVERALLRQMRLLYGSTVTEHFRSGCPGNPGGILIGANAQQLFLLGEFGVMQNRASLFVELRFALSSAGVRRQFRQFSGFRTSGSAKRSLMATDYGQATAPPVWRPRAMRRARRRHASFEPALLVPQALGEKGRLAEFGSIFRWRFGGAADLQRRKVCGREFCAALDRLRVYAATAFDFARSSAGGLARPERVPDRQPGGDLRPTHRLPKPTRSVNIVNIKIGASFDATGSSLYFGYGRASPTRPGDNIFRVELR